MHSVCPHDCPSACALVVTVADGRLTGVTGDPTHAFTQGLICGKVRAYWSALTWCPGPRRAEST